MRCRCLLLPVLSLLLSAAHSSAQTPVRFSVAGGALVDPSPYGKHASLSAAFPTPWSTVRLRIDGLLTQQREYQESFTSVTANVQYDARLHPAAPYLLAGAGMAVDASLALDAGLGWNLPGRLPLFVEWRAYRVHHDDGFTLALGARL